MVREKRLWRFRDIKPTPEYRVRLTMNEEAFIVGEVYICGYDIALPTFIRLKNAEFYR